MINECGHWTHILLIHEASRKQDWVLLSFHLGTIKRPPRHPPLICQKFKTRLGSYTVHLKHSSFSPLWWHVFWSIFRIASLNINCQIKIFQSDWKEIVLISSAVLITLELKFLLYYLNVVLIGLLGGLMGKLNKDLPPSAQFFGVESISDNRCLACVCLWMDLMYLLIFTVRLYLPLWSTLGCSLIHSFYWQANYWHLFVNKVITWKKKKT